MRKDERKASGPKGVYRVRNWRDYNAGLIARGDVTMWIDEGVLTQVPEAGPTRHGRPRVYSDAAIQMLLSLKQVFHLPLRALQGFAQSLRKLAFPSLPVPNYTTLSRRAQTLKVALPAQRPHEPMHLVIDSTGLKVYGEGEWKVRKHGWSKRRAWRKVHLAMDANTGQISAALMTHQDEGDGEVLPDLLDQIPADVMIDTRVECVHRRQRESFDVREEVCEVLQIAGVVDACSEYLHEIQKWTALSSAQNGRSFGLSRWRVFR
jgi:hypothetical protein